MKVIYEKTVSEKINDIVEGADRKGRTIKYVELSRDEWESLKDEFPIFFRERQCPEAPPKGYAGKFNGVLISIRDDSNLKHNDDLSEVAKQYKKYKESVINYPYKGSIAEFTSAIDVAEKESFSNKNKEQTK